MGRATRMAGQRAARRAGVRVERRGVGPFAVSVGVGLVLNFLVPRPEAVVPQAWALLSIFLSTIASSCSPLPVGRGPSSV